jgi:hypothetical protein
MTPLTMFHVGDWDPESRRWDGRYAKNGSSSVARHRAKHVKEATTGVEPVWTALQAAA